MTDFLRCIQDIDNNEEQLLNILKAEANVVLRKYSALRTSIFAKHSADVKMLLQSKPDIFWDFWDYCGTKHRTNREDSEILTILREKGAHIMEGFFSQDEVELLKGMWNYSFLQLPEMPDLSCGKERFRMFDKDGIRYSKGGPYDGRMRIIYSSPFREFPKEIKELITKKAFFNQIVQDYFHLNVRVAPWRIMMEHLTPTRINRNDKYWHIDNLSDQFKIMIILEDMTEKDGPFSFIPNTHRVKPHQKERYHKMYAMSGVNTNTQNHFEGSFTDPDTAQTVVAKAGDIVLFDCRTHHSGNFVQQGGSRKNIMLNYNRIPTLRNVIFFLIDPYLQV